MNDRYKVRMEVTEPEQPDGAPHYKIIDVLDFTPGEQQFNLKLGKAKKNAAAKPKRKRN